MWLAAHDRVSAVLRSGGGASHGTCFGPSPRRNLRHRPSSAPSPATRLACHRYDAAGLQSVSQSRAEVQAMVQAAKSQGLQFFLPTDIFEFPDMLLER